MKTKNIDELKSFFKSVEPRDVNQEAYLSICYYACHEGLYEIVQILIQKGIDVSKTFVNSHGENSFVNAAIIQAREDILELLVRSGASLYHEGFISA